MGHVLADKAWKGSRAKGSRLLVLSALGYLADDKTGECEPMIERIAALAHMTPRQARYHLRALAAAGKRRESAGSFRILAGR